MSTMPELLEVRREGEVAVVSLRRGSSNALVPELLDALVGALREAEEDTRVRAVVVTGNGRFFSAGFDLFALAGYDRAAMERFVDAFTGAMLALAELPKPVVAAIDGHAPAGGCILALACDRRLMAEGDYVIGLNELEVGIPMPPIAVELARAVVEPRFLAEVCFGGELVPPPVALERGLVDELVPPAQLVPRALEWARRWGEKPAAAFAVTKRSLRAPVRAAMEASDLAGFLDVWFSPATGARVRETLERLAARKG